MSITIPAGVTTAEWWDLNGTALNKYGWNVETVGGSRYGTPPMRGNNITYAYVPGQAFSSKLPDSRVISLAMWVTGVDPDTGVSTGDQMIRWNDSWDFLRSLLWDTDDEFDLTRRWILTDADGIARVHTATARGQLANELDLAMSGRTRGTFKVDILLADPFFYGADIVAQLNVGQHTAVVNPGNYTAAHKHCTVQLVGPLDRPEIYNASFGPPVRVKLDTTIAAGETVTLDIENFTAQSNVMDGPGGSYSRLTKVIHSGARHWMGVGKTYNEITLYAVSGTGHAVVTFRPPYV